MRGSTPPGAPGPPGPPLLRSEVPLPPRPDGRPVPEPLGPRFVRPTRRGLVHGLLCVVAGGTVFVVLTFVSPIAWWGWLLLALGAGVAACCGMVSSAETRRRRNLLRAERGLPPLWWGEQEVPRSALVVSLVCWSLLAVVYLVPPSLGSKTGSALVAAFWAGLACTSAVALVQQRRRRRAETAR